jgi:putative copper resistance protein D
VTVGAFAHVRGVAAGTDGGALLVPALTVAAIAAVAATVVVDRRHPANPVPDRRLAALLAGLATIALALLSPLDALADEAYSAHMVQHLLLTMVAAPLLVAGAPITLLLRLASRGIRRSLLLPALHSQPVRLIAHPVVGWAAFVAVSWAVHLTPLFGAALADPGVHEVEHALLLGSGLLFWFPVIAADPVPWRLDHGARFAYVSLALPAGSLLGLVIYSLPTPLWSEYVARARMAGIDALADQRLAGSIMWVGGDMLLLAALAFVAAEWFVAERRRHRAPGAARPEATARS